MKFSIRKTRKEEVPGTIDIPDTPPADPSSCVPIAAITEDMLITRHGTFLVMLEFPTIDMDAGGKDFAFWVKKHQTALEKIPPGITLQFSVQLEPRDPESDLHYFMDHARKWYTESHNEKFSQRQRAQAASISNAAQSMTSFIALWYDHYNPVTWRTICTLTWKTPFQPSNSSLPLLKKDGSQSDHYSHYMQEAKESLSRAVSIVATAFSEAGMSLRPLSPGEMCQVVWRGLHPAANNMPSEKASDMAVAIAQGRNHHKKSKPDASEFWPGMPRDDIKNLLSPDTILERETHLEVDGVRAAGYVVRDFRPGVLLNIHRLMNLNGGWISTLFMDFVNPAEIAPRLRDREVQLSAKELAKGDRGIIQSFANQQEVAAVQQQRMALETAGRTPINIRFMIIRTAHDEETLRQRCQALESLLETLGVDFFPARYNQQKLWLTTIPVGELITRSPDRNMDASSLSTFFWPARRHYTAEKGIYLGIDQSTQLPIRIDPFGQHQEKTPTFLALGRPGVGKSVWLRTMATSALIAGENVMAIDIEGEMRSFCDQFNGRYIEIGGLVGERINVLDIPPDSDRPLEHGTKHLVAFCEAVRGSPVPKGPEWNALAESYRSALIDKKLIDPQDGTPIKDWDSHEAPILKDIAKILAVSRRPEAKSLSEMLHPYTEGLYKDYFNTRTTFDIRNEKLVVFGLSQVNFDGNWRDPELQVYLWQIMGLIWSEIIRRHQQNPDVANHIMFDEVWALLRTPGGADAIENIARRGRKRHAALWMASQEIGEFLESAHSRQILSIVGAKVLKAVEPLEADLMRTPFRLSDFLVETLTMLRHGEALLQMDNAVLRVSISTPKELGLF